MRLFSQIEEQDRQRAVDRLHRARKDGPASKVKKQIAAIAIWLNGVE